MFKTLLKKHLRETKIAPVVRGLQPGKATERGEPARPAASMSVWPAADAAGWFRFPAWARWVERRLVFPRAGGGGGRGGLGCGRRRDGNPGIRGRGAGSSFPSPHASEICFAQAGIGAGQKGAVGIECHPEGKMKDKR